MSSCPHRGKRYQGIYDQLLAVEPGNEVNFLIAAPCEYPTESAIETTPDVRIMTSGSSLCCIAKNAAQHSGRL